MAGGGRFWTGPAALAPLHLAGPGSKTASVIMVELKQQLSILLLLLLLLNSAGLQHLEGARTAPHGDVVSAHMAVVPVGANIMRQT